jgi:FkbM family methyltransferase
MRQAGGMNLSAISRDSLVGKILRLPLRLVPSEMEVRVLQGTLRGKRWIAGASDHGCWLGSYEHEKQRRFAGMIVPGSTVFDVGAHVGYYTLIAAERAGPSGRVVAFEPLPRNLRYLHQHVRMNAYRNISIVDAAVAECSGQAMFAEALSPSMGHLAPSGSVPVRQVSLDHEIAAGALPAPDVVKIDIEGAEALALRGARHTLASRHPTIFLATHGADVHHECLTFLRSLGYSLSSLDDRALDDTDEVVATP